MGVCDTWNVEINILADENETFSLLTDFHFNVQYRENFFELHNDLPFLSKRMKIGNVEKLAAILHNKTEYVIHIRNLKQTLNHQIILKQVYKVIRFNQNHCLKPYIDMNSDLRKKAKNDF